MQVKYFFSFVIFFETLFHCRGSIAVPVLDCKINWFTVLMILSVHLERDLLYRQFYLWFPTIDAGLRPVSTGY